MLMWKICRSEPGNSANWPAKFGKKTVSPVDNCQSVDMLMVQQLCVMVLFRCLQCLACRHDLASTTLTSTYTLNKWKACF